MKILKVVFLIWIFGELVIWARGHDSFYLWDTLPLTDHSRNLSPAYTLAALVMLCVLARGLKNLSKRGGGP